MDMSEDDLYGKRGSEVLRAFIGYEYLFSQKSTPKLDANYFPIVKIRLTKKQAVLARVNINEMIRVVPHYAIPAYVISNAVHSLGKVPYFFDPYDGRHIDKAWDIYTSWITRDTAAEVKRIKSAYSLFELSHIGLHTGGMPLLLELLVNDEISVQAAMEINRGNEISFADYDTSKSLLLNEVKTTLDTVFGLQRRNDILTYFDACRSLLLTK